MLLQDNINRMSGLSKINQDQIQKKTTLTITGTIGRMIFIYHCDSSILLPYFHHFAPFKIYNLKKPFSMKTLKSFALNFIALLLLTALLTNCKSDDPKPQPPTITSINPTSAKYGSALTISGTNFQDAAATTVKINGVTLPITASTATTITATVPKGIGSGKVTVETTGGSIEGPAFTYLYTVTVSTFAGNGTPGYLDGTGTAAKFNFPAGLVFDSQDNLFVADRLNHRIRKITPAGVVTTFAGNGLAGSTDGTGTAAQIASPSGITIDGTGNFYISTTFSGNIRKMTPTGELTTIAGNGTAGFANGPALSSQFSFPTGVVKDSQGNFIISDLGNSMVRKISASGIVSTLAGETVPLSAWGITIDTQDNYYVSDFGDATIKKITSTGLVSVFAGTGTLGFLDGAVQSARFQTIYGLTRTKDGDFFILDSGNSRIRKISNGQVTTLAGEGTAGFVNGDGSIARFDTTYSIAINSKGEIFIGERGNFAIRKIVVE
jgi:hypothetical protein